MSHQLNVPARSNTRMFVNDATIMRAVEFINKLRNDDAFAAATRLILELNSLNRQKVDIDTRLRLLDVYRKMACDITELLATYYAESASPLTLSAKKNAQSAIQLWQEVGYGYKIAFLDFQKKIFGFRMSRTNAYIAIRAIDALRQQCLIHYLTYTKPPSTIWSDMHRIYGYALSNSFELIEVDKIQNNHANTVNAAYIRALLLSTVSPQNLTKHQILRASRYIKYLTKYAKIRAVRHVKEDAGIFLLHLSSDSPPVAYSKTKSSDKSKEGLLIAHNIAAQIQQHLKLLRLGQANYIENATVLQMNSQDADLLEYLANEFSTHKSRAHIRHQRHEHASLAFGLESTLSLFNAQPSLSRNKISNWEIVNSSPAGFALKNTSPKNIAICVGDLVTIQEKVQFGWMVASVVWLNIQNDVMVIGVKLLGSKANTITLKSSRHHNPIPALLLNEVPFIQQAASIVTMRGQLTSNLIIEVEYPDRSRIAAVDQLIERSARFERYEFSLIENKLS